MNVTQDNIKKIVTTERAIHNIARILGAIAKAYIAPVIDESHTNFFWCNTNKHLQTRKIRLADGRGLKVSYHPAHLHIHFEIEGTESHKNIILLKRNSLNYVLNKIDEYLTLFGLAAEEYHKFLEYRFPELNNVDGKLVELEKVFIHEFEHFRSEANSVLINYLSDNNLVAEPRIWPHNFDTGITCQLNNNITQFAGYAPADETVCEVPYFYNSFYKNGMQLISDTILKYGEWKKEGWKGAILPITQANTSDEFLKAASLFLKQSSQPFLT